MSNEEIQKITKQLENKNPAMRQLALEQLSSHKQDHTAMNLIIRTLQDEDKGVRTFAAEILGDIEDRHALISLTHILEDKDWEVRQAAIGSFGKHKNPETVPFLVQSLRDEHPQVRYSAAKELKHFDSPSMIEPLFEMLKDGTDSVREEAKSTLLNFQVKVPASLIARFILDLNKTVKEVAVEFLTTRVEGNPLPHLEKALEDKEWSIRLLVLTELGKIIKKEEIKDSKILQMNLKILDDENARVRFEGLKNLKEINDLSTIDKLGEIARNDEDSNNRLMATETMTFIRRSVRLK
ncbi:MAG: HEAT repeat domain-containing protein [Candidatus Heimdallarchaeota archaeon]|nr:HEAT repeat domain-containing protein [Candidatus Heimdallarchaeota archaeon]MCK4254944.1 HEAT repeat domain-containing protein [Candidatus Heimdallarchaeota archaeon]